MEKTDLTDVIVKEAHRIEEDSLYSMKGHFNAGNLWARIHLIIGLPSAILASWAGIEAFSNDPVKTAILALLSAALTATNTFLSPQTIADNHRNAGREYNKLRNRTRLFREIDLSRLDDGTSTQTIVELAGQRDSLNSMSPDIPRWAYHRAIKDIDEGKAKYKIDETNKE